MLCGKRGLVNEFRVRKRYNFVFEEMKHEIPIRIRVIRPMAGVTMQVQSGKDELLPPTVHSANELVFEFEITADLSAAVPNFLGKYAHGPKDQRFIYVNSGRYAGQHGTCWDRRAKITLMSITLEEVEGVLAKPGLLLETAFQGIDRDGGPTCASVKGIELKVAAK